MSTSFRLRPGRARGVVIAAIVVLGVAAACGPTRPATPEPPPTPAPTVPPASDETTPEPTAEGAIRLEVVAEDFDSPLDIAATADDSGRLFVVEQGGRIQTVRNGVRDPSPFLDISARVRAGGERGLLGLALHPDFPRDDRIFVDYTDVDGNTVVSSFTMSLDGDVADPGSERILLQVDQPFANHNGGAVAFGPDGMLYISLGDGGSGGDPQGNGQNLGALLGKILRIDVDHTDPGLAYAIPSDNPYADGADGARPEIWLSGLRNVWRMRFDPKTGDLWLGDVGQGSWEEIDVVRGGNGGLDLGWNIMEGSHCYKPAEGCDESGLTLPFAEYDHSQGCAVVGGVVIRDETTPTLDGRYIYSDNCTGTIWLADPERETDPNPEVSLESGRGISAIAEDADGVVYLTDLLNGELLRLEGAVD